MSGITLTDTSQQFPISNLSVDFVGTQTSPSSSASGSAAASGSAKASSSSTASAKRGAGTVRFDYGIMVLIVALSMGGSVRTMVKCALQAYVIMYTNSFNAHS